MKSKKKKVALVFLIVFIFLLVYLYISIDPGEEEHVADVLFHNGEIVTVDESNPEAEAVWVSKGRIRFVGSNEVAMSLAPSDVAKIDLKGRTLVPGFNDNHTHSFGAGRFFQQPLLWGKTCQEIEEIVGKEALKIEPGETIMGSSWDYPGCPEPHKSMLDRAAPRNPVFLMQYSAHAAWVNSRMLEKMEINRNTPDPKGGQIVRDKNGEPTGILRDTAMESSGTSEGIADVLLPGLHKKNLDKALDSYRKSGITSVQDNTWMPMTVWYLAGYKKEGKLSARFSIWPLGGSPVARLLMKFAIYDESWLHKGPAKLFADGAFSTRTAWLLSGPYADEPGNFGSPRHNQEEMDELVSNAARDRRQVAIHAIGDGAVNQILNAVEKAQKKYPWTDKLRFRIEHVQMVDTTDVQRMKSLGVLACIQPFSLSTPRKDVTLLNEKRAGEAYPFRTMLKAGIPVSFGSDIPAEVDYYPLLGMYYAVTRKNKAGTAGPLNPDERFTPYEALYAYTMGSAYAEFMENEKGSITQGKLADMVVLSRNPLKIEPEKIKDIRVLMTIVGGRIVHKGKEAL